MNAMLVSMKKLASLYLGNNTLKQDETKTISAMLKIKFSYTETLNNFRNI